MRWLEVRRHAPTKKGPARGRGSHLSAHGVAQARAVGAQQAPFALVVTSALPRVIETAVAMGWAVDDTVDMPSGCVLGEVEHHDQWDWPRPYVRYAELIATGAALAETAETHRRIWTEIIGSVPEGGSALVVSHGGAIEPALVSCLPDADHASWGRPFSHLDGARLAYEEDRFTRAHLRRAPSTPTRPWGGTSRSQENRTSTPLSAHRSGG